MKKDNKSEDFKAGQEAALNGNNINNSYPWEHEEFVKGYKSIVPGAEEDYALKAIAKIIAPNEYKNLHL